MTRRQEAFEILRLVNKYYGRSDFPAILEAHLNDLDARWLNQRLTESGNRLREATARLAEQTAALANQQLNNATQDRDDSEAD